MVDLINELAGKVAIVTGSARNIGRATAMELARGGAAVVINARTSKDLCEEVAGAIVAGGPPSCISIVVTVRALAWSAPGAPCTEARCSERVSMRVHMPSSRSKTASPSALRFETIPVWAVAASTV